MSKAHNLDEKERTKDVLIDEPLNFKSLLLSEQSLVGLQKNGFQKPSPIQLKAVPIGKCGFDLIVKSKSGTGKTLVFGLISLELIDLSKRHPQVLILAPTREIAVQIRNVIRDIGSEYKGLNVECFIGGLPIEEDIKKAQKSHVVVGAPGRIHHLIQLKSLNLKHVKLLVLDEVDKLITQNARGDINEIISKLPATRQTIAVSATLSNDTENYLSQCMSSPTLIEPTTESPLLLGIRQFVDIVKTNLNIVHQLEIKSKELIRLLSQISFTQCIIFTNYQTRAASVCNYLNRNGWNSMYISADQKQTERMQVIDSLKLGKCRILLSTDLTARGIDSSHVDLIINYDVPYESSTYLHRMGRAGRYGSKGVCITVATEAELTNLKKLLGGIAGSNFFIARLPKDENLPSDLYNLDGNLLQYEQSIVDVVSTPKENQNVLSSVVDLKSLKLNKTKRQNQKHKEESKDSSDMNIQSLPVDETSDFRPPICLDKSEVFPNTLCLAEAPMISDSILLDKTDNSENPEKSELKSLLTMLDVTDCSSSISNLEPKKRKRFQKSPTKTTEKIYDKNVTLYNVAEVLTNALDASLTDDVNLETDMFCEGNDFSLRKNDETLLEETDSNVVPYVNEEPNIDNIFKLSYDFAVNSESPNWTTSLGIDVEETLVVEESEPKDVITFARSPKKRYKTTKNRREKLNRKLAERSDNKETKSLHLNSLFDNGSCSVTASLSNHIGSLSHQELVLNEETSPTTDSTVGQTQVNEIGAHCRPQHSDHEYVGNQHFTECFQRYSDELTDKLQTFEDMETFENWYQHWQWQVQSVREYVQQNVYLQEMNKHMYKSS